MYNIFELLYCVRFALEKINNLNENEILMYLGYKGQEISPEVQSQIDSCINIILSAAKPLTTYKILPLESDFKISGTNFSLLGNDIKKRLENCQKVVLFAATLGSEAEKAIMQAQITDMANAVIMDACASAAIEAVCNSAENKLRHEIEAEGKYLTDRFSPGYGDMPISQQMDFCSVIDSAKRIGLTVTKTNLLVPQKSVTAIMGISDFPVKIRKKGCESCNMFKTCKFRKEGKNCGE